MHDPVMERGTLAERHDFDMLPRSAEIDVQPAQPPELSALAEMNLTHPDVRLLAGRSDEVSAIYVWAIAGQGRAMAGLGNVSKHLSTPRLACADLYAQPSSADGRNLMIALGFEPIPSYQHELWRYERPWNRLPPNT